VIFPWEGDQLPWLGLAVVDQAHVMTPVMSEVATETVEAGPGPSIYRVQAISRPGGQSRVRCNETYVKADTGSYADRTRPGPAELLCASLAVCLLKNVERFSELLTVEYELARVEVEAERSDVPPAMTRMHYRLEIVSNEPTRRIELLHRNVRKFGTITNTLAAAVDLTGEVTVRPHP